jgi:predicted transposase YbfD/YdcC
VVTASKVLNIRGYAMTESPHSLFEKHLDCIQDPRHHNIRHLLHDMLLIALCAVISGADSWTQVAEYGRSKMAWFEQFLQLPNGIPSHDTFGRLFARLEPKGFQKFFTRWVRELCESIKGKTVAIDGKTLRGSHDRTNGKSAIHMVSAWASQIRLVLGQLKVDDKSNEITAIPELIKTLALQEAIITIDAMGCQRKITQTIIEEKADYVIQLKENQPTLYEDVALFFKDPASGPFDTFQTLDGEHGRIETRHYCVTENIAWLAGKHQWAGIRSICKVTRQRELNAKICAETSYFISSLKGHAHTIGQSIREHWAIENDLHWCLDISFKEDHCRVRKDNAPENFGILRHMAINLLKKEKSLKGGIQTKRLKAAWDQDYLLKILGL